MEGKNPHDLITEDNVKSALKLQCGTHAKLTSWEIKDFTSPGDNYVAFVTSVLVDYSMDSKKEKTSFIVKLSSTGGLATIYDLTENVFKKESSFYTKIVPELNRELTIASQPNLKVPKCFYYNLEKNKEIIFLEDLRNRQFKLANRKKGLNFAHVNLVMEELGRLHASSELLKGTFTKVDLINKFSSLEDNLYEKGNLRKGIMKGILENIGADTASLIEEVDCYKEIAERLKLIDFFEIMEKMIITEPPFEVIAHGDCWTNNILFR